MVSHPGFPLITSHLPCPSSLRLPVADVNLLSLWRSGRFLVRALGDFLFPRVCFGCNEEIEHGLLCEPCRILLLTSELDVCPDCGRPCADAVNRCGRCRLLFSLSRVRALGLYGMAPFRGLIHALKYSEKTILARPLGQALAALVNQDTELANADAICPIPLHPARLRERGYNQSLLLAREVAAETGLPVIEPLRRVRNTKSQTKLVDDKARLENVTGAFAVRPATGLEAKRIIIVDDVMTTGATLHAAATQLLAAGAYEVMGLVVAAAWARPEPAAGNRPGREMRRDRHASPVRAGAGSV